MKNLLVLLVVIATAGTLSAQGNLKIGYTNVDFILSAMPEAKQIEAELKAYENQLQNQLQSKYQDFQTKLEKFQREAQSMTDVVRADKQEELQNLQSSIEKFQREAQNSMQRKQAELFQPAYDKIQRTIDQVAEENGYTHVLNSDAGGMVVLLYARDEDNISDLVLKKLGIDPDSVEEED